jgi:homoserine kinase
MAQQRFSEMSRTEIVIPASTSNLGASFDTCGLALSLYLKVTVAETAEHFEIAASGEGAASLPLDESNLIVRVARFVAEQRGRNILGARLSIENQIPLARGLGSSSAAIIAGISLYETLSGEQLSEADVFRFALGFEEHPDNLAPSLLGGLVVACVIDRPDGGRTVAAVKRGWPQALKVIAVIPDYKLETARMRAVLPANVPRRDAVFNVQRAALLQAAIAEGRFELISEALRDRLHQPYRAPHGRGLTEILTMNEEVEQFPGLIGVALSGAGPTIIAFAVHNSTAIAEEMKARLVRSGVAARGIELEVDNKGRSVTNGG